MQININEARTKLSALLDRAASGEEVVIARAGKPVARLVPFTGVSAKSDVRLGGLRRARLKLAPDFHAPMSDDELIGA